MGDNSDSALCASLSYIPFLPLLLIMYRKENDFMHFHARQGLILFIVEVVSLVLMRMVPFLAFILSIFNLLLLALAVTGIFTALMGRQINFPVIGELAEKLVV